MTATRAAELARRLHRELGGEEPAELEVTGPDHVLPSVFAVETLAAGSVAAAHLAAGAAHVGVDVTAAAIAFRSERYLHLDGKPAVDWAPLTGDYRARDGFVRIHANFDHHRAAALRALGAANDRDALAAAIAARDAIAVEDAVIAAGGAAGAMRDALAWDASPAAAAIAAEPVVALRRLDDAPPRDAEGRLRVLDLSRVIAGPTATKVLAHHGADVGPVAP